MNKTEERRVEEVLGKPCHMAQNREWLYDHLFVTQEDHGLCGCFFREMKYKDGFIAIDVELSHKTGLCTAKIYDVRTKASSEAYLDIPMDEWDAIMTAKSKFTSEHAEEAVKEAILAAIKREEFIVERKAKHSKECAKPRKNDEFLKAMEKWGLVPEENQEEENDEDEEEEGGIF